MSTLGKQTFQADVRFRPFMAIQHCLILSWPSTNSREEGIMDHQAFAQLLGSYGEFVGAIAVVATLMYLAV